MKNNKTRNKFTLVSDNTAYQPYNVNTEDVLEVWKAQMIISKANTAAAMGCQPTGQPCQQPAGSGQHPKEKNELAGDGHRLN